MAVSHSLSFFFLSVTPIFSGVSDCHSYVGCSPVKQLLQLFNKDTVGHSGFLVSLLFFSQLVFIFSVLQII